MSLFTAQLCCYFLDALKDFIIQYTCPWAWEMSLRVEIDTNKITVLM